MTVIWMKHGGLVVELHINPDAKYESNFHTHHMDLLFFRACKNLLTSMTWLFLSINEYVNSNTRNRGSNSTALGESFRKCRSQVISNATFDDWRLISWQRRFCTSGAFLLDTLRNNFTRCERPARARCDWPIRIDASIATTVKLFTVLYAALERYGLRLLMSCSAVEERMDATRCSNQTVGSRSETCPSRNRRKLHSSKVMLRRWQGKIRVCEGKNKCSLHQTPTFNNRPRLVTSFITGCNGKSSGH